MNNKLKFLLLSCFIITLPLLNYFISGNYTLDIEDLLCLLTIIAGTFIVIQKAHKYGLFLWIVGFAGPRIFYILYSLLNLLKYDNIWLPIVVMICQLAICLCFCRLALQWSTSLWLNPDNISEKTKKNLHLFWKIYIELEMLLIMSISVGFIELISMTFKDKIFENHILKMIPIWGIYAIYKYFKKTSLRILSPIGNRLENEEIDAEITKAQNEDEELKTSLNRILSTDTLETLQSIYVQELQKFPHKEPVISKAYKKQNTLIQGFICVK